MSQPPPELVTPDLEALQATDDPLEKAFICLGAVAEQVRRMRTWDELRAADV